MGEISEKSQISHNSEERNASVLAIEDLVRGQLGYGVKLLDAKYLLVMPSENTSGIVTISLSITVIHGWLLYLQ